jgi:hypothetical protein
MRLFVDLYHYSAFSDGTEGGNPLFAQIWLRRLTWCKILNKHPCNLLLLCGSWCLGSL